MSMEVIDQLLCFNVFQISTLKSRLKKVSTMTGDGVARAFLKSQAALFGSYRNALQIESVSRWHPPVLCTGTILPLATSQGQRSSLLTCSSSDFFFFFLKGEPITFNEEVFLNHRSSVMKQFLQNAIQLQLFKQVQTKAESQCSVLTLNFLPLDLGPPH